MAALPSYGTTKNVFFDADRGLSNIIQLEDRGAGTLVGFLWEDLTEKYQLEFDEVIIAYGNTLAVTATAGKQEVVFGGAIAGSDPTGFAADGTAGYQEVVFGVSKAGGDATGLANDATVYTASVDVDGGGAQPISIVGSAAQTFTTLLAEINADLTGATASLVGGNIRITSDVAGASSAISIVDTDLFSTLTDYTAISAAIPGTAGTTVLIKGFVEVDGKRFNFGIDGDAAPTIQDVVDHVNAVTAGYATMTIGSDRLVLTSDKAPGVGSSVVKLAGDIFTTLTGFTKISNPYPGVDTLDDVLRLNRFSNGSLIKEQLSANIRVMPPKPPVHSSISTSYYWNGTNWVRHLDDAVLA